MMNACLVQIIAVSYVITLLEATHVVATLAILLVQITEHVMVSPHLMQTYELYSCTNRCGFNPLNNKLYSRCQ